VVDCNYEGSLEEWMERWMNGAYRECVGVCGYVK